MDKAIAYFAPEAVGSPYQYFTDGRYYYQRIRGLGALGALDGWLKKVWRKTKKVVRSVGRGVRKGVKKVGKVAGKVVKKVGKVAVKVIKTALPIVNTALTFIPGVGWAAKAVLTAAEMGMSAIDRAKKRKKLQREAAALNRKTTRPVKPAHPLKPVTAMAAPVPSPAPAPKPAPVNRAPVFTANDFIKINRAVTRDRLLPDQVATLTRAQVNQNLHTMLNF